MNILYEDLKIRTVLMSADGFHNFWLSFCDENQKQSSAKLCQITY
jgi:hypothetical protein